MIANELNNKYFKWIYQLVCDDKYHKRISYKKLFNHLNDIEFISIIEMDNNRAEDGIDLRYRFGYEHHYESSIIKKYLDDRPCSVLEMITSLAIRCEENIMNDPDIGDRTSKWFWNMIDSLGLSSMNDNGYNPDYVDDVVYRFLNREYGRNGDGGLFTVNNAKQDLRDVEIWYQMCWYLDNVLFS